MRHHHVSVWLPAAVAVLPGAVAVSTGFPVPPNQSVGFGIAGVIFGLATMLLVRQRIRTQQRPIKTVQLSQIVFCSFCLILLYIVLYQRCVVTHNERGTAYYPIFLEGPCATIVEDSSRWGAIEAIGVDGVTIAIAEMPSWHMSLTTVTFLLLFVSIIALQTAFFCILIAQSTTQFVHRSVDPPLHDNGTLELENARDGEESEMTDNNSPALRTWQEKLEFLQTEEAVATDAATRFTLKKQIEEARKKIAELSSTVVGDLGSLPKDSKRQSFDFVIHGVILDDFLPRQDMVRYALATFLDIDVEQVHVSATRSNSVQVSVVLPEASVHLLMSAVMKADPDLRNAISNALANVPITVTPVPPHPASQTTTPEGSIPVGADWFDELPLNFNKSEAKTALNLLKSGYSSGPELQQVARLAGLQVGLINFNQAPSQLPMKVMDRAASEGRLPNFLAEVLMDPACAGIHKEMWLNLGSGAARIHQIALSAKADFNRVAALPASSIPVFNGNAGDLQKIVNALSHFQDSAVFRFELAQREARVARIDVLGKGVGTGWLVAGDILLTAMHVVEAQLADMSKVTARFDYKIVPKLNGMLLANGREVKLAADPILASSSHDGLPIELSEHGPGDSGLLDFALLRLTANVGGEGLGTDGQGDQKRGWFQLPTATHTFDTNEGLFVLGHPQLKNDNEAGPMKLTLALPSAASLTDQQNRVRYSVNTEGGNSGSPVMEQNLMPVALHHCGSSVTPTWDVKQQWTGGFNQGIPLDLIVASIREQLVNSPILDELSL